MRLEETPSSSGTARTSRPQPAQEVDVAPPPRAEAEVLAGDDYLCADRAQVVGDELLRLSARELLGELDDEDLVRAGLLEELEAPLERRQQLDVVAEHEPRVRVEREDGRAQPGLPQRVDHPQVAAVDAVERPDRRPRARRARARPGERATVIQLPPAAPAAPARARAAARARPRSRRCVASHRVGRTPIQAPSAPPTSAPIGRMPQLTKLNAPWERERILSGVSAYMIEPPLMSRIMTPIPERNSAAKSIPMMTERGPSASGMSTRGAGKRTQPSRNALPTPITASQTRGERCAQEAADRAGAQDQARACPPRCPASWSRRGRRARRTHS